VLYNLIRTNGSGRLVDYDIALLFQPCLLLGVSNEPFPKRATMAASSTSAFLRVSKLLFLMGFV
jgi:hypothetical protein